MEIARLQKGKITFYNLDGDEIEKKLDRDPVGMRNRQKKQVMNIS